MPHHSRLAIFARVVLLPLGLALGTVLGLGSYAETSDDGTLAWLFAGVLALKPVASVPLYLHGYGHLLAAAYAGAPGVPWLGLLLGGLLSGASVLFFAVLDRLLRPYLRPWPLTLGLVLFFGVAWLEHWLWFSHARVALLLAGSAVLFAAQRPARRAALLLGLAGLGAAWLIRPSLAVVALGAVVPAAVLLAGSWRRAAPVLLSAAVGLTLATGAAALVQTPSEARTQQRDASFARILDFHQLRPAPRTPADSLGTSAVNLWLMGDSTVVNATLFRRAYRFDAAEFFEREMPAKLQMGATMLGRDYFPLLLALAASAADLAGRKSRQPWFWLVQLGFVFGLLLLAGLFKLPPRLALPLLDFWLLTNAAFLVLQTGDAKPEKTNAQDETRKALSLRPAVGGGLVVVLLGAELLYGAKTWHRHLILSEERRLHENALHQIAIARAGRVLILAGTSDLLKSLSPLRAYALGHGPVLQLTGWSSHDTSQASVRRALTGTTDQSTCLRRLAQRDPACQPLWVLTPETAAWLSARSGFDGLRLLLYPAAEAFPAGLQVPVRIYHAETRPKR